MLKQQDGSCKLVFPANSATANKDANIGGIHASSQAEMLRSAAWPSSSVLPAPGGNSADCRHAMFLLSSPKLVPMQLALFLLVLSSQLVAFPLRRGLLSLFHLSHPKYLFLFWQAFVPQAQAALLLFVVVYCQWEKANIWYYTLCYICDNPPEYFTFGGEVSWRSGCESTRLLSMSTHWEKQLSATFQTSNSRLQSRMSCHRTFTAAAYFSFKYGVA